MCNDPAFDAEMSSSMLGVMEREDAEDTGWTFAVAAFCTWIAAAALFILSVTAYTVAAVPWGPIWGKIAAMCVPLCIRKRHEESFTPCWSC